MTSKDKRRKPTHKDLLNAVRGSTAFFDATIGKDGVEPLVKLPLTHSAPGSELSLPYREAMEAARGMSNVRFDPTGAERSKVGPTSPRMSVDEEKLLRAIAAGKVDATIHEPIPGTDNVRVTIDAHDEQTVRKLLAEVKRPERPTVADALRTSPLRYDLVDPKEAQRVRGRLLSAPRFVLDEAGWTTLYDFIDRYPDLIAEQQQFALLPYDTMWVEWSLPARRKGPAQNYSGIASVEGIGFLIDGGDVNTALLALRSDGDYEAFIMPVVYRLHQSFPPEQIEIFLKQNTFTLDDLDHMLWGTAFPPQLKPRHREAVRLAHTLYFNRHGINRLLEKTNARTVVQLLVEGCNGDLCDILAFLLLVNQPGGLLQLRNEPAGRRFASGKLRPYMSHTKITLHIGPHAQVRRRLRRLQKIERGIIKAHDVRAHFCHDKTYHQNKNCIHQMKAYNWMTNQADEDPPRHWVCELCLGKRWHFRKCTRGSSTVGFNVHDYNVTR